MFVHFTDASTVKDGLHCPQLYEMNGYEMNTYEHLENNT